MTPDPRWQTVREALGQFSFQATNPYLADEALAALDSLEEENVRLRERATENWDSYENANREIERLREALKACVVWFNFVDHDTEDVIPPQHPGEIARAALEGEEA